MLVSLHSWRGEGEGGAEEDEERRRGKEGRKGGATEKTRVARREEGSAEEEGRGRVSENAFGLTNLMVWETDMWEMRARRL